MWGVYSKTFIHHYNVPLVHSFRRHCVISSFFFLFFFFFQFFLDNSFFPHITTVETVFTYPQSNEPKHSQNKVAELNIYARARACVRACVWTSVACRLFGELNVTDFLMVFKNCRQWTMGLCFLKNTCTHFCNDNYTIHFFSLIFPTLKCFTPNRISVAVKCNES